MTWEETIKYIRTLPEYDELIEKAYLDERLELNVERYLKGEEWAETLNYIKEYAPDARSILDVGSGNGISAIAFALAGYGVTAVEPDKSDTVGCGAIKILRHHYKLSHIEIIEDFAENVTLKENSFDLVYCRQTMHHANNLNVFVKNITSCLKQGGMFFSVRDHIIYNTRDREWFLQSHPLQKFYNGENAFTAKQYKAAFKNAGLKLISEIRYYDSVINYYPTPEIEVLKQKEILQELLSKKTGKFPAKSKFLQKRLSSYVNILDESRVPGRMYSYICIKQ